MFPKIGAAKEKIKEKNRQIRNRKKEMLNSYVPSVWNSISGLFQNGLNSQH